MRIEAVLLQLYLVCRYRSVTVDAISSPVSGKT